MVIAWMYRADYQRAGYHVLPTESQRSAFVTWMTLLPLHVLIPLTLAPVFVGHIDAIYILGVLYAGSIFLYYGFVLVLHKSNQHARRLLLASIVYLPVVFALLLTTNIK
jgi:protoheme IX farnesyltransferase